MDAASAKQRAAEAALVVVRWEGHYSTLAKGDFLQTATDPPVFWRPGKPNAATLQAVLRRRKTAKAALELQKEGWGEFAAGEKRTAQLQLQLARSRQAQAAQPDEEEGSDDGEVKEAPPLPQAPVNAVVAPVQPDDGSDDGEVAEAPEPVAPCPPAVPTSVQSPVPPAPISVPQVSAEDEQEDEAAAAAAEEEAAALLDDDSDED